MKMILWAAFMSYSNIRVTMLEKKETILTAIQLYILYNALIHHLHCANFVVMLHNTSLLRTMMSYCHLGLM
jgi:hypothetical protein